MPVLCGKQNTGQTAHPNFGEGQGTTHIGVFNLTIGLTCRVPTHLKKAARSPSFGSRRQLPPVKCNVQVRVVFEKVTTQRYLEIMRGILRRKAHNAPQPAFSNIRHYNSSENSSRVLQLAVRTANDFRAIGSFI